LGVEVINATEILKVFEGLTKKYKLSELEFLTDRLVEFTKKESVAYRLKHNPIVILEAIRHYFGVKQYFSLGLLENALRMLIYGENPFKNKEFVEEMEKQAAEHNYELSHDVFRMD